MFNPEKFEPSFGFAKKADAKPEKLEFGKHIENSVVIPFLNREMKDIFPEVVHASEKGDKKWKVDVIAQLPDGSHLCIQSFIISKLEAWREKAKDLVEAPLIKVDAVCPGCFSKKTEISPKVLLLLDGDSLYEAYYQLGRKGQGEMIDFIPDKEKLKFDILQQMISCLTHQLIEHPSFESRQVIKPKLDILNTAAGRIKEKAFAKA